MPAIKVSMEKCGKDDARMSNIVLVAELLKLMTYLLHNITDVIFSICYLVSATDTR